MGLNSQVPSLLNPHENAELKFDNQLVKLLAIKAIPKLRVAGGEVGPLEENTQFEARVWVSDELIRGKVARLAEDAEKLTLVDVQKAQIKETMQASRRLSTLPENFYPKLRRFLRELKEQSISDPGRAAEFQRATHLATDVVTSRLNKVLLLASASQQAEDALRNMTAEEKALYKKLYQTVNEWRTPALKL